MRLSQIKGHINFPNLADKEIRINSKFDFSSMKGIYNYISFLKLEFN
jgi:hypothetical protein